jgi:hypothetical protein
VFGALCIVSALCTLCLPETKDHELPEDMADIRKGPFINILEKVCPSASRRTVIIVEGGETNDFLPDDPHDE